MIRLAQSLLRLTNTTLHPQTISPIVHTTWRGDRSHSYPLNPPVEITHDEDNVRHDYITINGETFKRRSRYFRWLCLPPVKIDQELLDKAHEYNMEFRKLTEFTDPPVYPGMKFYREWFDLMIKCDMYYDVDHIYTLMIELQLDIIFDDDLKMKIDEYLDGARARSYHNWEF